MDDAEIKRRTTYHAPDDERRRRHERIRGTVEATMRFFDEDCPEGREKSLAMAKLEESMFWANAAIARPAPEP